MVEVEELLKLGVHFGYSRSRRHPSVQPFLYGVHNRTDVMDLEKIREALDRAKNFIYQLGKESKQITLVGTKTEAKEVIAASAQKMAAPYVVSRWLGGTFTNFPEIRRRIDRLEELLSKRDKGELTVYTKKERSLIDKEIADLQANFSSLTSMKRIPDAVFIVDVGHEKIALAEAKKMKLPVVSLSSSDCDISQIDYPIVASDASLQSIKLFTEEIADAYLKGQADRPTEVQEANNAGQN